LSHLILFFIYTQATLLFKPLYLNISVLTSEKPVLFKSLAIMNGVKAKRTGTGEWNMNDPFGNNPFVSIPYDINPLRLVWLDILSIFELSKLLLLTVAPLRPCLSGPLDELYPSWANMTDMFLHTILIIIQLALILTLPIMTVLFWFLPGLVSLAFVLTMLVVTLVVMRLLNGGPISECYVGLPEGKMPVNDEHELWFFINGITIGYVIFLKGVGRLTCIQEALAARKSRFASEDFPARNRWHP
jgi:hypothetical protein